VYQRVCIVSFGQAAIVLLKNEKGKLKIEKGERI